VKFGMPFDELELDRSQLDLAFASADELISAVLETKVAALAAVPTGGSALVDRVRRTAASDLAARPSPAAIASELRTSERTLRRQLEREGTSVRALIADVRLQRARELLAVGRPVKDVALSLGFSEPSAFSRAYKRWTGRSPT